MGATIGDGIIAVAICSIFVALFLAIGFGENPDQMSDYQKCLSSCPKSWGKFENLECPKMCGETVSKFTQASVSPQSPNSDYEVTPSTSPKLNASHSTIS